MTISAAATPTTSLASNALAMQAEAAAAQAEAMAAGTSAAGSGSAVVPAVAAPAPKHGLLSSILGIFHTARAKVLSLDLLQQHAAAMDAAAGVDANGNKIATSATQAVSGAQTLGTTAPAATTAAASTGAAAAPAATTSVTGGATPATVHIAQYRGAYLPDGPDMRPNCGPASITMALRLVGRDIPGFHGQKTEAVLDAARVIGTGRNDTSVGTTDSELEKVVDAAGAKWSESADLPQIMQWARQGIPVVLAGNPSGAWDKRYNSSQVYNFDGGHWVTLSGYDSATGRYVVNDPLSQVGAIEVTGAELQSYFSRNGGLGIAVFN